MSVQTNENHGPMTEARDFVENRQFERYPLMLESTVSVGQEVIDCVIFDISAGVAKVRLKGTEFRPKKDQIETIVLHIPGFGGFEGKIIWTDNEYVGINFREPHKTKVKLVIEKVRWSHFVGQFSGAVKVYSGV